MGGEECRVVRANTIETKPAALLVESRTQQKSFLFLLPARRSLGAGGEEKVRRAQKENCRENFFAGGRVVASGGGLASFVGGFPKMGSDFVQGMEHVSTIARQGDFALQAPASKQKILLAW